MANTTPILTAWAEAGDTTTIPSQPQTDSVSYADGWPTIYETPLTQGGKAPVRLTFNTLFNVVTAFAKQIQQNGYPEFMEAADMAGVAFPYPDGIVVQYNGVLYQSVASSNTSVPGTDSNWISYYPANVNNHVNLPIGCPQPFAGTTAPTGWIIAMGQAFDTAAYPELAKVFTNGLLPDLRGVFLRGLDLGRGFDVGRGLLSYQSDKLFEHSHNLNRCWSKSSGGADEVGTGTGILNSEAQNVDYTTYTQPGFPNAPFGLAVSTGSGGNGFFSDAVAVNGGADSAPKNVSFVYILRLA